MTDAKFEKVMADIYKLMLFREGLPSEGKMKELLDSVEKQGERKGNRKMEIHIYKRWKHMCRNYRAIGMCDELGNNCQFEKCPLLKESK